MGVVGSDWIIASMAVSPVSCLRCAAVLKIVTVGTHPKNAPHSSIHKTSLALSKEIYCSSKFPTCGRMAMAAFHIIMSTTSYQVVGSWSSRSERHSRSVWICTWKCETMEVRDHQVFTGMIRHDGSPREGLCFRRSGKAVNKKRTRL